ncbi:MAG: hypothetical protein RR373_09085, partial [Akkermansia sp.]
KLRKLCRISDAVIITGKGMPYYALSRIKSKSQSRHTLLPRLCVTHHATLPHINPLHQMS